MVYDFPSSSMIPQSPNWTFWKSCEKIFIGRDWV